MPGFGKISSPLKSAIVPTKASAWPRTITFSGPKRKITKLSKTLKRSSLGKRK